MRRLLIPLLGLCVASCGGGAMDAVDASPAPDLAKNPAWESAWQDLLTRARNDMARYHVPGMQLAVLLDGHLVYSTALGQRGLDDPTPVDEQTRFRYASLTKSITAATAVTLAEEGKLSLTAPITDAIPGFTIPQAGGALGVTLDQLLDHTAGLADIRADLTMNCSYGSLQDAFTAPAGPPWNGTRPGSVWDYANPNFTVAGYAIERAAGAPYTDVVRDRILTPAGMSRTTFSTDDALADGNVATGILFNKMGPPTSFDPTTLTCVLWTPPAGLWGTARDLARWAEVLLNDGDRVLTPSVVQTLESRHAETRINPVQNYGYGLFRTEDYSGLLIVGHDGRLGGFQGDLYTVPSRDFGLVVLVNADWSPNDLGLYGVQRFLGVDAPQRDWMTDPATWADYAGTYCDKFTFGRIIVTYDAVAKTLHVSFPDSGNVDAALTQFADDTFAFEILGDTYHPVFWRETPGAAPRWFVLRAGVGDRDAICPPPKIIEKPRAVFPMRDLAGPPFGGN